jgi:prepilin-type N-terminal cleavage/methylation domain-containing protein
MQGVDVESSDPRHARRRGGLTLLELLIVVAVVGVLVGLAFPRARGATARRAVRSAARDVALLLSAGRQIAATSAQGAAVAFDEAGGAVRLVVAGDTVRTLDLAAVHGVALVTSRDSLAYDWRGLGVGAANLTVVVTRPPAAETLYVSRLGRVRGGRW